MKVIFSRLKVFIIIICFLVLSSFVDTQAFDGKRKGFFLGVGIGPGISVGSDGGWYLYGKPAFTLDYKIGYGSSERLLIYLTIRSSFDGGYSYNYANEGKFRHSDSSLQIDGTGGLGFMLFPNQGNNLYFSGCFGWGATIDLDSLGFGISGGIGYEILPNLAIDLTLDYRRITYVGGDEVPYVVFSYASENFEDPSDDLVTLRMRVNGTWLFSKCGLVEPKSNILAGANRYAIPKEIDV